MPKPTYIPKTGNRKECTSIDPELVMSELSKGNFIVSSNKGTYSPEQYTTNYISSIFDALESVQEFWNSCKQHAGRYINEFVDVPDPESITDNSDFLDEEDELIDNSNTPSKESEQVTVTNGEQKTPNNSSLGMVTIKATALNIRSGPGTDTSIIGSFKNGDTVDIDGYEGNWIRIKISDDKYAYISGNKKYVSVEENVISTPKPKPIEENQHEEVVPIENIVVSEEKGAPTVEEPAPAVETTQETPSSNDSLGTAYINAESLKVRTKPNMDSEVIDYYHNGQSYEILGYEGKWIKIKTPDNHEAYISAKPEYVTIMENGTEGE